MLKKVGSMIVRGCSLVIILISAIVGSDAIYAKNEFPVPPGTFTTYVTDSSIHNGFKTTIVKFQSRYPVNSATLAPEERLARSY